MLSTQTFHQQIVIRSDSPNFDELNRLLAAAVVSRQFCALLFSNPAQALAQGFAGEQFSLSPEEYHLVLAAQGLSLQEFARQLCNYLPPQHNPARSSKPYAEPYSPIV